MFLTQFTGASFTWEQHKLGDLAESSIGGGTPKTSAKEYWGGTLPWIQSSDLIEDKLFNVDVKKHITNLGIKNSAAKLISQNSIAVVTRVGVGKLAFMPFEYATSQDFLSLSGIKGNPQFVTYTFQIAIKRLAHQLQGTSIKGITKSELLKVPIKVPLKKAEQDYISKLFFSLENSINLHERKCEELTLIKQALLQKLFPKKDEIKPEVRYENFSDAWEQRKLGEVFDTVTDYVANGSFKSLRDNVKSYTKENYAYMIRLQDASNNWKGPWLYTDEAGYSFLTKSKLHPNDIIMSNVGSVGKFFLIPELDKPMTLAPNAVLIKSSKNNALFLYQMMISTPMQVAVGRKTTPGVQLKINKTDFKRIQTNLPSLNEQEKIGEFFKQLDSLIALHQRKLEKLKQLKKFLLQNMFI